MKAVSIEQFKIDNSVAYLIQQVSGDSTQEILGYFHGIAMFVGEDIAKKSKASWITKDIVLFYKETPIPFRLIIHGESPTAKVAMNVEVCFPKKSIEQIEQDVTDLMDKVLEVGLGLAEEDPMPKFLKPELKSPRCLRTVRIKQDEQRK